MEDIEVFDLIAFGGSCVDFTYVVESGEGENSKSPIKDEIVSGGGQAATSAVVVSLLGEISLCGNLGWDEGGMLLLRNFVDLMLIADGRKTKPISNSQSFSNCR